MFTKQQVQTAIESGVIHGDGHSIFPPAFYSTLVEVETLDRAGLVRTFRSDYSNPKTTIFDNAGNPIDSMTGVYNLDVLEWIANLVEVEYVSMFGRGSQARSIVDALSRWATTVEVQ